MSDVAFGWWNDKDGNSKYFWSGGNTDNHTCQCGIDKNCVETYVKCNCDAAAPVQLSDDGKFKYEVSDATLYNRKTNKQASSLKRAFYLSRG